MLQVRLSGLMLLILASIAGAEPVKITLKIGERKQHTFKNIGDDPKLLNKSDDIFVGRDFADPNLVTIQVTPTVQGVFYFGIASTKEGKTLVEDILIEVTGTGPAPERAKYVERLTAPYLVSPGADDLKALIDHLTTLNKSKYATRDEALLALRKHTITGIKGVRDEIGKILGEQSFTSDGFQSTIADIIVSLKELK